MITQEHLGFLGSIYPSLIGMLIVFISLIFIAIYVVMVSKVIAFLEANVFSKKNANKAVEKNSEMGTSLPKDDKSKVKIAVITAAIAEELGTSANNFVITDIKKINN